VVGIAAEADDRPRREMGRREENFIVVRRVCDCEEGVRVLLVCLSCKSLDEVN
jgi:hypothetical protein